MTQPLNRTRLTLLLLATLLAACADVAWWFGWSVQEIYALPINEFADWLDEANRQIKEKYRKS